MPRRDDASLLRYNSARTLSPDEGTPLMDPYRLPRSVVPSRYDLRLEPDLASASFTGEVAITVAVHEPVSLVLLNAAELRIDSAVFLAGSPLAASVSFDEPNERALLTFERPLPLGE